jgi:hypothetical protein
MTMYVHVKPDECSEQAEITDIVFDRVSLCAGEGAGRLPPTKASRQVAIGWRVT